MSLKEKKAGEVQFPANKQKLRGKIDSQGQHQNGDTKIESSSELKMVGAIALLLLLALGGTLVG